MPDLDTIFRTYDATLLAVSYDIGEGRMDATFRLTMRDDRFDEPLHDRLVDAHDGYQDEQWRFDALDTDRGDDWATCVLRVEALVPEAGRLLQPHVIDTLPTFHQQGAANGS